MEFLSQKVLEDKFPSEEAMGVYYEDDIAKLANGEEMGICTNIAHWVVDELGEGSVYGFLVDNNPVEHHSIEMAGGHDFALVRGRYIVDPWISHYTGDEEQTVFDMKSSSDQEKIKEIYGDPAKWSFNDPETSRFVLPGDNNYPDEARVTKAGILNQPPLQSTAHSSGLEL